MPIGPLLCTARPVGAGPPPGFPGSMGISIESVGADPCVGPATVLHGTHPRADTQVRPYAVGEAFRNQRESA